jgi:hypothetical protein
MAKRNETSTATMEDTGFDPYNCELKTTEDFEKYNRWARMHKRPVKVPDESFYPKVKIKFQRFDQPENVLKARVRNKDIDWTGQLKPGCVYELATPVVKFLNRLAVPKFEEVRVNEGDTRTETRQTGEICRFSCQVIDF